MIKGLSETTGKTVSGTMHARQTEKGWLAELPLMHDDKELRAYANMRYQLDEPYTGAGYYYGIYTVNEFNFLLQFKLPKQKGFRK